MPPGSRTKSVAGVRAAFLANLLDAIALVGAGCVLSGEVAPSAADAKRARELLVECTELTTMYHVPYAPVLPWIALAACHRAEGEPDRAMGVLSEALAAYPANALLLLEAAATGDPGALARFDAIWSDASLPALPAAAADRLRAQQRR